MQLHINCGGTAPKVVAAHEAALTAFANHAMRLAVCALSTALISPDVIKACTLAVQAYGVYGDNPMKTIEQRLMKTLQGHILAVMAQQNIDHPVLNDIGLTIPEKFGVLPELEESPMRRGGLATELKEKRRRIQQKGAES